MPPAAEGRVLLNLDEFMLRAGHLSVLADVANELGGNEYRVLVELAEQLTRDVVVPDGENEAVAEYLEAKGLCLVVGQSGEQVARGRDRYPDLSVRRTAAGPRLAAVSGVPRIWWQDYMLSEPAVPSRVGAVTVSAKSGSRTGLSHILDWAVLLDLTSRAPTFNRKGG